MVTMATAAEDRLAVVDVRQPDAPTPFDVYVPAVPTGNLLFRAGRSPFRVTRLGSQASWIGTSCVKAGREAAQTAALNMLGGKE